MRTAVFLISLGLGAVALAGAGMAQDVQLPEGPGKDKLMGACMACHGLEQVTGQQKSKEQWTKTIEQMIANGATLTDEDSTVIVDYLSKHFASPAAAPAANP